MFVFQSLYALAYAIFITSAFCYFLITWSNKHLPSSIMTAFWPMQVAYIDSSMTYWYMLSDSLFGTTGFSQRGHGIHCVW